MNKDCLLGLLLVSGSSTIIASERFQATSKAEIDYVVCPYDDCGRRLARSNLARHKRTHTGEKPYVCGLCSKGFVRNEQLVFHKHTHTGEKPYACVSCGKCFARSGSRARHMFIHNKLTVANKKRQRYSEGSDILGDLLVYEGAISESALVSETLGLDSVSIESLLEGSLLELDEHTESFVLAHDKQAKKTK